MSDEKRVPAMTEEIQNNLRLFELSPTPQEYHGAVEFARTFVKCTILKDTSITYSACSSPVSPTKDKE